MLVLLLLLVPFGSLAGRPLQSRPNLAYDEQKKTGSGSLRVILPLVVTGCEKPKKWKTQPGMVFSVNNMKHICPAGQPRCGVYDACYVETGPFCSANRRLKRTHFVISTAREPCDWMVSQFNWMKYHKNGLGMGTESFTFSDYLNITLMGGQQKLGWAGFLDAHTICPLRTTVERTGDIDRNFSSIASNVDCWVHLDNFAGSLHRCLLKFQGQGGRVNWENPVLDAFLHPPQTPTPRCTQKSNNRMVARKKNNPGGAVYCKTSETIPCRSYFPPELASRVMADAAPLYRAFGWGGCCISEQIKV